jgi:hypothetical protein
VIKTLPNRSFKDVSPPAISCKKCKREFFKVKKILVSKKKTSEIIKKKSPVRVTTQIQMLSYHKVCKPFIPSA